MNKCIFKEAFGFAIQENSYRSVGVNYDYGYERRFGFGGQ